MIRDALTVFLATFAVVLGIAFVGQCAACVNTSTTPTGPTAIGDASDLNAVCNHLVSVGCGSSVPRCLVYLHNEVYGANDAGGLQPTDLACMLRAGSNTEAMGCLGVGVCPP